MREKVKLVQKVKCLVRKVGLPRWLHSFGPKKYEFWQHILALLIKQQCQLSYRRTSSLLRSLGLAVPTYSALAKMACRLPIGLWQRLLKATCNAWQNVVAVDSTWYARSNPSYHYQRRIDRKKPPGIPIKLSLAVDTAKKQAIAAVIRVIPRGDTADIPLLIKHMKPKTLVADKGYDAEWIHQLCHEQGINTMIPKRTGVKRGHHRRKSLKNFRPQTYRRRELAEAIFSALKRKFGTSIRCQKARTIRAEIYCRLISHNIHITIVQHFQLSRFCPVYFQMMHTPALQWFGSAHIPGDVSSGCP